MNGSVIINSLNFYGFYSMNPLQFEDTSEEICLFFCSLRIIVVGENLRKEPQINFKKSFHKRTYKYLLKYIVIRLDSIIFFIQQSMEFLELVWTVYCVLNLIDRHFIKINRRIFNEILKFALLKTYYLLWTWNEK